MTCQNTILKYSREFADMKICSKCKEEKNEIEFYKNKHNKDGLQDWCKICIIAWKNKNKNSIKETSKKCNEKHKEKYNKQRQIYKRKYTEKFPEKVKLSRNSWRQKFPEIYKEKNKEDYKKHKLRYFKNAYKRYELIMKIKTDINEEFLEDIKKLTPCCKICGVKMEESQGPNQYNLDHIIPLNQGGPHLRINVRWVCRTCNFKRPNDGSDIKEELKNYIMNEFLKIKLRQALEEGN